MQRDWGFHSLSPPLPLRSQTRSPRPTEDSCIQAGTFPGSEISRPTLRGQLSSLLNKTHVSSFLVPVEANDWDLIPRPESESQGSFVRAHSVNQCLLTAIRTERKICPWNAAGDRSDEHSCHAMRQAERTETHSRKGVDTTGEMEKMGQTRLRGEQVSHGELGRAPGKRSPN